MKQNIFGRCTYVFFGYRIYADVKCIDYNKKSWYVRTIGQFNVLQH